MTVLGIKVGELDHNGMAFTEEAMAKMAEICSGHSWDYEEGRVTASRVYVEGGAMYADLDVPAGFLDTMNPSIGIVK